MAEVLHHLTERERAFDSLLQAMLAGGTSKTVIEQYRSWLETCLPEDLVRTVDRAILSGTSLQALKPAVAKLINLMHDALSKQAYKQTPEELFLPGLCAENLGLKRLLETGKTVAGQLNRADTAQEAQLALQQLVQALQAVEIHLRKKENILFPWFEAQYPHYRCVRLMWDIHDDIRNGLKALTLVLGERKPAQQSGEQAAEWLQTCNRLLGKLYFDLNTNIFREECALFPVIASLIPAAQDRQLHRESCAAGWAFLSAAEAAEQEQKSRQTDSPAIAVAAVNTEGGLTEKTGSLPPEILSALFSTIHLDMTWVDTDDRVRWFSDSPKRIFPRSPAILGRDIRNCHPGSSVDKVIAIIESFRSGKKDRAEFWITMAGKFVHIEYFALRSPDGRYLGTLEASEDLSHKRQLKGEKRLLDEES